MLIIDDDKEYSALIADSWTHAGYETALVTSVADALKHMTNSDFKPRVILADRMLKGVPIESHSLESLSNAAQSIGAFIVVYTRINELTTGDIWAIQHAGATRVIEKTVPEKLIDAVNAITKELDELWYLQQQLDLLGQERSKLVAALVWTDVGVTVIDDNYHCWFANEAQSQIVGRDCARGLCWCSFHERPAQCGPCWGCTVTEVLKSGEPADRMFLSRFADGSMKWVSVRSVPIKSEETGETLGVREGVFVLSDRYLQGLSTERRLSYVAQGLIQLGFGRARVYRIDGDQAHLDAAAARDDDPDPERESDYRRKLRRYPAIDATAIGTLSEALAAQAPTIILDSRKSTGPLSKDPDVTAPYWIVPVRDAKSGLRGFVYIDFVGTTDALRDYIGQAFSKEKDRLELGQAFASQVSLALNAEEGVAANHEKQDVVLQARLGIGYADSVEGPIAEVRAAFEELFKGCRVSVRLREKDLLREHELLCCGERSLDVPETISERHPDSLAADAVRTLRPWFIDDYKDHLRRSLQLGNPRGLSGEGTLSCAHVPIKFENKVFGSLSVDSPKAIQWEEEGYMGPLLDLSELAALVLRDLALDKELRDQFDELRRSQADIAALTAYAITVSSDAIWRHWAVQRLAEASNWIAITRMRLSEHGDPQEVSETMHGVEDALRMVSSGRPEGNDEQSCTLTSVLQWIEGTYPDSPARLDVQHPKHFPRIQASEFYVRHIISVLVDNARQAIEESSTGHRIHIEARTEAQDAVIEITDDGPGVPAHLAGQILCVPVASGKSGGSGVGLLFARGAALQFGGDLCQVPQDQGAGFMLKLPLVPTEASISS
jgi:GAF domain-containing protein/CheY-like chemotaxis protein